ncbi:MAG: PKD repeat protein [Cryomorphaceae bacterium]|jgi:PKD repeat protein
MLITKTSRLSIWALISFTLLLSNHSFSQAIANPDTYCYQEGQTITDNVLSNDSIEEGLNILVMEISTDDCLQIDELGFVRWTPLDPTSEPCCGVHILEYYIANPNNPDVPFSEPTQVEITVKCPKPDCNLIDLSSFFSPPGSNPPEEGCVNVCENSDVTFFVPWNTNNTYQWSVPSGGSGVVGSNPAEYIVSWGTVGSGFVSLQVTDAANIVTTVLICVDILPTPVASFTTTGYACLDQCLQFTNTSVNASQYLWDFGDGNTSPAFEPCYTYANPGSYTVTLTATNQNFAADGSALCCCTDVFTFDVEIDPLPGPPIYWVSTLCEGDEACYWTTATNCTNYTWTVLDANAIDITSSSSVTGQGTDTICVNWAIGPVGTISLMVSGCDSLYCNNPSTVQVPIIPSVSTITGPIVVCANSTEVYSLPKWLSTNYDWTVTGGTVSGSGHSEPIQWGAPGTGTIQINYSSEFLQCTDGHDENDCSGVATLNVTILPSFDLINPGPTEVCVGSTSSLSTTSLPSPSYNWTVSPSLPANVEVGNGTSNFSITWGAPGVYVITAQPNLPNVYCNDQETTVIKVIDVPPPAGITGPLEICPSETAYYTAVPTGSGFGFSWTALNGTPSPTSGSTVGITWGATGPYSLTLVQVQQNLPFCQSLPVTITPVEKGPNGPYTITGGPSCLNELNTYTLVPNTPIPPPHPDIVLTWSLSDPTKGSIVSGQGTNSIQVQWGNTPGSSVVQVGAELCGNTVTTSLPVVLTPTQVPVISQVGLLCPGGGPVTLNATAGFTSYLWSNLATTPSTTTSTAGTVSVTTIDPLNGCPATAYKKVETQPGPVANIYSNDGNLICLQNPSPITMIAQTSASYQFTWYCSGPTFVGTVVVQGPSSTATYTHNVIGTAGTYTYYFTVTDLSTGCTEQSPNYFIIEETCSGSGSPCITEPHNLTGFSSVVAANCDEISFGFTSSNFTFGSWTFGDGNSSTNPSPTHTYASIGCYTARVCGTVPEDGVPGSFCTVCFDIPICIPLKADFSVANPSCGVFNFTDLTTFLPGPGNGVLSYSWKINGIPSSTSPSPSFTITTPSTVELTVTNGNGCESVLSTSITPNLIANPTITAPTSICMNESFNFSLSAPGAVSYAWTFGPSTFGAQMGQFAYASPPTTPGPNTISVIVTDVIGCTGTASVNITVFPEIPPGVISAAPDLVICQGSTTTLTAPPGYSYLWSPGSETTQSISVGMGVYGVTHTDSNGCTRDLDEVEVEELPLPDASISGNLFICDAGCTMLSAPINPSNTYEWLDNANTVVSTSSQINVCVGGPLFPGAYSVRITDQNGCSNTAGPVTVQVATSPSFAVSIAPVPACAGQPTTLGVTPFDPSLNYVWSTGATTPTITVNQAGTYTVVGTDPVSGCSSSASGIVHPLPDLCLVPVGCYDICPPKTICGPSGLEYQWNLDGMPIPGETDSCLTVISSGDYSLTATNQFGCPATSGQLILNVLNCPDSPCDSLSIEYEFLTTSAGLVDSCCAVISYGNQLDSIKGLNITTSDGDLNLLSGSLSGLLNPQSVQPQYISLTSIIPGNPIPEGVLSDFATICIENAITTPQVIYLEWLNMENEVICNDSIVLNCPVEPDCIYLASDSIYCKGNDIEYSFTVCNPSDATYSIGYIDLLVSGPAGIVVSPPYIDLSGSPLLAGNCQTFTVQLSGPGIEGETFCFNMVGHLQNPVEFPGTLCCSLDTTYCIDIPYCNPCPFVQVEGAIPAQGDGCCHDIVLINNFTPGYFDEIGICVLSPQTTLTVDNPIGSGWLTSGYTGTSLSFLPDPVGSGVPIGTIILPRICLQTNIAPMQEVEVKWMKDGIVVCRDTIDLFCEPPCGYFSEETISCEGTSGNYFYQALLNNNSGQTINDAFIQFTSPAGMGVYDQTITFAPLLDGQSVPINFNFGPPTLPGDSVCFTVTLHSENADGVPIQCCQFEYCFITPQCPIDNPTCTCDDDFEDEVNLGFTVNQNFSYTFGFSPNSSFLGDPCNTITWVWGDGSPSTMTNGASDVTHSFPTSGKYKVCMIVERIDPVTGEKCEYETCMKLGVPFVAGPILHPVDFTVFPNPGNGLFVITMPSDFVYPLEIHVADMNGKDVKRVSYLHKPTNDQILLNLSNESKGVYFIRLQSSVVSEVKKVIIN